MSGLRELQCDFSRFIWGGPADCGARIVPNGFEPEQRLAIYRHNTQIGLIQALREVYPVVARLVGDPFFNWLGAAYLRQYPPNTGCLQTFGEHFAEFLDDFEEAAELPYLADSARLEWRRQQVYFESDQPGIGASSLDAVPPDSYGRLRFELRPTARLFASRYPVLRIWQSNQADHPEADTIALDEGGCRLLIHRSGWEIEMIPLDDNAYRFLTAVHSGQTLNEAAGVALHDAPDFDLAALLHLCLSRSLFGGYFLA